MAYSDTPSRQAYPPYAPADTPPGAEARLEGYRDALEQATEALTEARNAELAAEEARDAAKWRAESSDECPKVGVFGGVRVTVDYRKAWIKEQIKGEEHAYQLAKIARRAATAHLRKVEKQGGFQQSITASVREQYRTAGRQSW